jgi:hypothetical protein
MLPAFLHAYVFAHLKVHARACACCTFAYIYTYITYIYERTCTTGIYIYTHIRVIQYRSSTHAHAHTHSHKYARRCAHNGKCSCFNGWEGENCDVQTDHGPLAVVSALWCENCQEGARCIVNGLCANNARPLANQAPYDGRGILTLALENMECTQIPSLLFSWGLTVESSRIRITGTAGSRTFIEMTPPASPKPGPYLIITSGGSWPMVFFDSDFSVSCAGSSGCNAPVSTGAQFRAIVTNMPVASASELDVTIADLPVTFALVTSDASHTVLLITPPDCSACRFSSRSELFVCFVCTV